MQARRVKLLGLRGRRLLAGLSVALAVLMVDVFTHGPLVRLDLWVAKFNGRTEWPALSLPADIYDKVGQRTVTIPILLIVAGVLGRKHGSWRPVLLSLWMVLSLNLVVGGLKVLVGRAKPSSGSADVLTGGIIFPSGHSANMVLTGGLIIYLLKRYTARPPVRPLLLLVAALTTMTVLVSLYRDTHWLTDLIGGALVGGLLLEAVIVMDRATARVRHQRQFWLDHPKLRWVLGSSRLEGDADAVDAEAVTGRGLGGVVEDVSEVRAAPPAPDLRSSHPQ